MTFSKCLILPLAAVEPLSTGKEPKRLDKAADKLVIKQLGFSHKLYLALSAYT